MRTSASTTSAWSKLTDGMLGIEEDHLERSPWVIEENTEHENLDDSDRDLPKCGLAYTHEKLLELLTLNLKSSVDGTLSPVVSYVSSSLFGW